MEKFRIKDHGHGKDHKASGTKPDPRDVVLTVHDASACGGAVCLVHNPTNHKMREWPMSWRSDVGILDRLCIHGVAHPDPDQLPRWADIGQPDRGNHVCDGCCLP